MANTVWKFPLQVQDVQEIEVPSRSKALTVQMQGGVPCIWYAVQDEYAKRTKAIRMFGTGHHVPAGLVLNYIGTVQDGELVWHVFEEVDP